MTRRASIIALVVILLITAGLGCLAVWGMPVGRYDILPVSESIQQGLDLHGGVYAVYEVTNTDVEQYSTKFNATLDVLRRRLDAKGFTEATISPQGSVQIRIEIPAVSDPAEALDIIGKPALLQFFGPDDTLIMEGNDVAQAEGGYDSQLAKNVVHFRLTDAGKQKFAEATAKYINQAITIKLDGETLSEPTVNSVIDGGAGYIEGGFTIESAKQLGMLIENGALPLVLNQIEVRTISATLGENALSMSLLGGAIGIAILLIYLAFYYRLSGIVADIGLIIFIIIDVFALALFKVQLTLPGIAGIFLSIGMAVDANVIIFEQLKEEMRSGKSLKMSVELAFRRASSTIIDSNTTGVLASLILMYFGTGPIKGFAITLVIGILVSLFTAVVVSRFIMKAFLAAGITKPSLYCRVKKEAEVK